jgi:hypothetical protein
MPTVPLQSQPSVGPAPLAGEHVPRRVAATDETFGGGAASYRPELQGLADIADQMYREQKRRSDQVAVMGAAAQSSALANTLSEHARSQEGTASYGAVNDVQKAWQDGTSKISMGLANDDQKVAFQGHASSEWNSLNAVVQNHVSNQHRIVAGQAVNGYTAQQGEKALLNASDPSPAGQMAVSEAVANTRAAIMQYGDSQGQDPTYTKVHADEAVSKIHGAVLTRMLGSVGDGEQPTMAAQYYALHKDEIVGPEAARFDGLIAKKSVEGTAQQQADVIKKQSMTLSDAMTQAGMIQDPNVRDKTEERLRRSFADDATNARQVREQRVDRLTQILHSNKGDFDALPIEDRNQLSEQDDKSLHALADGIRNPKKVTNVDIKTSLMNSAGLHPDKFMGLDLSQYRDQLSDKDFNALQSKQLTMRLSDEHHDRSLAEGTAKKDATAKAKTDAAALKAAEARKTLEALGVHLGPTVPGAPLAKPSHVPGQPPTAAIPPAIQKLNVPQSWKDHAAKDTAYANYLTHHGAPDE